MTRLTRGRLCCAAAAVVAALPVAIRAEPSVSATRVFLPDEAEKAREIARRECVPLVVHVLPATQQGYLQLNDFYGSSRGISTEALGKVIVAVIPRERFPGFVRELGITSAGGLRTISPYTLSTLDARSKTTCQAGFI